MRNNQIRAGVSIDQTGSYGDKKDVNGRTDQEKYKHSLIRYTNLLEITQ